MSTQVIIDTNVIIKIGKNLFNVIRGKNYEPVFPTIVLFEYMKKVRERVIEYTKSRNRAKGYINAAMELFITIKNMELHQTTFICPTIDNFIEGMEIMISKDVDAGDAILASIAKQHGLDVISNDDDWDRLKDYANRIRI